MEEIAKTRTLIDRLARLNAGDAWSADLNPSQIAALGYLAQANRFSRSPSHVADYLASTRGTVSQTLRALERKGLIAEAQERPDRRSIRYDPTEAGRVILEESRSFDIATEAMPEASIKGLNMALSGLLSNSLKARGMRTFGMCQTCSHFERRKDGAFCRLLSVELELSEAEQICHEHAA